MEEIVYKFSSSLSTYTTHNPVIKMCNLMLNFFHLVFFYFLLSHCLHLPVSLSLFLSFPALIKMVDEWNQWFIRSKTLESSFPLLLLTHHTASCLGNHVGFYFKISSFYDHFMTTVSSSLDYSNRLLLVVPVSASYFQDSNLKT